MVCAIVHGAATAHASHVCREFRQKISHIINRQIQVFSDLTV